LHPRDGLLQELDMPEDLADQHQVMRLGPATQRLSRLWQLGPQDATRQVGQHLGILLAAEQRLEHLTTANPRTLLAIIASFTTLKISSSVAS
jgi:hypothetical protein